MTTTLFVYGTLKRGGSNHQHLAAQQFIGPARTAPGFTLFNLGAYPGLVAAPEDSLGVTGELWSVDLICLKRLDVLEGLAEGLYHRAPIALSHDSGDTHATPSPVIPYAETYFYRRDLFGRPHLGPSWPV
ncbi:MAG: gamma-glutamylcyclotransferase family protein [Opitutaceae bacterium]|jgi:gamma-glutamylaminecyclotransferase